MKINELLKKQAEFPREAVPWAGIGDMLSDMMYKVADMLPEEPDFIPEIPEIPTPPAPPWSK